MKKLAWIGLAGVAFGCAPPSSDVSPQVDAKIRDNLSRPLSPDEIKQMGATPSGEGSKPAQPPAGKGTPGGSAPTSG